MVLFFSIPVSVPVRVSTFVEKEGDHGSYLIKSRVIGIMQGLKHYKNGHRYDYEYKSDILRNHKDLLKLERIISLAIYLNSDVYSYTGELEITLDDAKKLQNILEETDEYIEAHKINKSFRDRKNRMRKRIMSMNNPYFLTLTFNDYCLDHTNKDVRRKYVTRYLKSISNNYIANIDYGLKNEREHYHAIVDITDLDISEIFFAGWNYGFYKADRIFLDISDIYKLSSYISKLTNHAMKESTKSNHMIYSRNK